ncbi:Protein of unknown function [Gryllus bimaculatus]|nr:Protein of unknown function [Gryllus bimaculatus]
MTADRNVQLASDLRLSVVLVFITGGGSLVVCGGDGVTSGASSGVWIRQGTGRKDYTHFRDMAAGASFKVENVNPLPPPLPAAKAPYEEANDWRSEWVIRARSGRGRRHRAVRRSRLVVESY